MHSRSLATLWYFWRRTWLAIPIGIAFGTVTLTVLGMVLEFTPNSAAWPESSHTAWSLTLFVNEMFALIMGVTLATTLAYPWGKSALPRNVLHLPIRTRRWALGYMTYTLALVGLFAFGLAHLQRGLFGCPSGSEGVMWIFPFLCIGTTALMDGIVIFFAAIGSTTIPTMLAGSFAILSLGGVPSVSWLLRGTWWSCVPWLAGLILGYILAITGYTCQRRGAWEHPTAWLASLTSLGQGRRKPFASVERALAWYEWRRFGRYLVLASVFCCPTVTAYRWLLGRYIGPSSIGERGGLGEAAIYVGIAAIVFGMFMTMRDYYERRAGTSGFMFTQPIKTRGLAMSRLAMTVRSLALACVIGFVPAVLVNAISGISAVDVAMEAGWVSLLFGIWVLIWFGVPLAYLCLIMVIVTMPFRVFVSNTGMLAAVAACIAASFWVIAALICVRTAWRRGYLTRQHVLLMALTWESCTAILWFSAKQNLIGMACYAVLVPLPFATVPLAIDWYRHR